MNIRRASSSESAANVSTLTMACGQSSVPEGRKFPRQVVSSAQHGTQAGDVGLPGEGRG